MGFLRIWHPCITLPNESLASVAVTGSWWLAGSWAFCSWRCCWRFLAREWMEAIGRSPVDGGVTCFGGAVFKEFLQHGQVQMIFLFQVRWIFLFPSLFSRVYLFPGVGNSNTQNYNFGSISPIELLELNHLIPRRWWSVFMPWRWPWKWLSPGWKWKGCTFQILKLTVSNQFALENQWLEYSLIENCIEKSGLRWSDADMFPSWGKKTYFQVRKAVSFKEC